MTARVNSIRIIIFISSIILGIYAYLEGLNGPFLFDDAHVIKDNHLLKISTLEPGALVQSMESFQAGGRQISMLSFALNHYFFGESTWWLKAINLLIHCLNGALLFLMATMLVSVSQGRNPNPYNFKVFYLLPAIASAFWVIAPINLTSVLYISQRMTLLSTLFVLIGIVSYIWARQSIHSTQRKLFYLPLITGGFTFLAFSCKENGALLPLYLFVIELFCFRFCSKHKKDKVIVAIFCTGASFVLLAVLYKFYQTPDWLVKGYSYRDFSPTERILTQLRALVFYIYQIILPSNNLLGLWHDDFRISTGIVTPISTILSATTLLCLFFVAFLSLFKAPLIGFGILWFFVAHSIESTIIPLEMIHEHRNYLGSFGILFSLIALVLQIRVSAIKLLPTVLLAGLFLWNATVLTERSSIWASRESLAIHEAVAHPNSPISIYSLGIAHMNKFVRGDKDAGERVKLAWLDLQKLDPNNPRAELALIVASESGAFDYDPDWLENTIQKLPNSPKQAWLHSGISAFLRCLEDGVCTQSKEKAYKLFDILLESDDPQFLVLYALFYANVAKDNEKADTAFQLSLRGEDAINWTHYLFFLIKSRNIEKACEVYKDFSRLLADHKFRNSGMVLHFAGTIEQRLKDCQNV